jgi:hypothetical protein
MPLTATTLHMDRWVAGSQLMRTADAAWWSGLVAASGLWRDNAAVLDGLPESRSPSG